MHDALLDAEQLATCVVPAMGVAPTLTLYSVWVPRGGDNLLLTVESVANTGAFVGVQLVEKNRNETGDGTTIAGAIKFNGTTGRTTRTWLGVKEQVRFKFTLDPGGGVAAGSCGLLLFRCLMPTWFETVKA